MKQSKSIFNYSRQPKYYNLNHLNFPPAAFCLKHYLSNLYPSIFSSFKVAEFYHQHPLQILTQLLNPSSRSKFKSCDPFANSVRLHNEPVAVESHTPKLRSLKEEKNPALLHRKMVDGF